jgi:hypothetical protein
LSPAPYVFEPILCCFQVLEAGALPRRGRQHAAAADAVRSAHIYAPLPGSNCIFRYNHRERLRQENVQTIVSARVDIHKNPPLKLDPSEFRVKKGTSKEVEEQLALERKRMEVAEAKQVQRASCFPRKIAPVSRAK